MNIQIDKDYYENYYAVDADRYDGAPDGDHTTGWGRTEQEAIWPM